MAVVFKHAQCCSAVRTSRWTTAVVDNDFHVLVSCKLLPSMLVAPLPIAQSFATTYQTNTPLLATKGWSSRNPWHLTLAGCEVQTATRCDRDGSSKEWYCLLVVEMGIKNIISMCQFWEVYVEQQSSQVWDTTCELCLDAAVQCDKEWFLETLVSDHLSLVSPTDILTITSLSLRSISRLPVSTNVKLLDSKALFRGIPVKLMDIKTANTNPLYCHLELSPNGYAHTWRWVKSYKTLSLRRDESSRVQKKTTWEGLTHNRTGRVHNWIDERKVHSLKLLN